MTDEEKYNFGSLMSLLIESERKLKELYETTARTTSHPELKLLLSNSGKNSLKRMEKIGRARVETVVEMALEPITDLKLNELLAKINSTIENGRITGLQKVVTLERTISELYSRTSPKIKQISAEAGELLTALSHESTERLTELEQYIKSA